MVSDRKTDLKNERRALEIVNMWVNTKDSLSFPLNFFK